MDIATRSASPFPSNNAAADSTVNRAAGSVHGAVDHIAVAAESAAGNVKPAIDRAAQLAHQAVSKVAGVAGPTAHWIGEQGEHLDAARRKAVADAAARVAANPWKALGLALLAGFVISRYLR